MNNRLQLLYVDDEPDNLTVFSSRFRRLFRVHTASSAQEGLSLLKKHAVQIVISDHRMPEMTGVEFLQKVRELYPDSIRIIITAHTDSEDIIEAINKGGVYLFIKKPWAGDELKLLLDKAFSFYNLRMQNQDLIQRLYKSINDLEMFYYRISHELRGPIASQYGVLSLAKTDSDPVNSIHYFRMLEDAVRKLDSTIRRVESTHLPADRGQVDDIDFRELIERILMRLKDEIQGRDIVFHIDVEPGIRFKSYQNLVNAFLENLIENGIFFSDPAKSGRSVNVQVRSVKDSVTILVEDNGLGIEDSQLESIFNAFYRGHAISKGTGLGLYIVKKSVNYLNGRIEITSQENTGTNIFISLPRKAPDEVASENS